MIALIRMRLTAFAATGRIIAPLIAALIAVGTLHGGGQTGTGEAFGTTAVVLFPLLAWQTKALLDTEPDVQRRLVLVAIGSPLREIWAGAAAALIAGLGTLLLGFAAPFALNALSAESFATGLVTGVWAMLLVLPPAVALGALASRPITRSAGIGVAVLVGGSVLAIVLSLPVSPVPWLAPPLVRLGRYAADAAPDAGGMALFTMHAVLWTGVVGGVYAYRRLSQA
ncbi:hypothetical protein F4553_007398 [Allocatelliglobosispora scoriae]|uniref:ABC transporter permease n=1 Tax=Allocatelliglobosispora scoriae TaxID=643052 RepID=A0A841C0R2_9ACTN|nr:hypothetical protein [Allocatelliglobosispora scoriae]MBB5873964.1 hypothetical protein [Allocatelliglobosispora scoriae]